MEHVSNARLEKVSASPENGGKTSCKRTRMQMSECEILEDLISGYTLNSKALIGKISRRRKRTILHLESSLTLLKAPAAGRMEEISVVLKYVSLP